MTHILKEIAEIFLEDIATRPDDFKLGVGEYCLVDTKTGRHWWIASGGQFFNIHSPVTDDRGFSLFAWRFTIQGRCWRAYKKWKKQYQSKKDAATIAAVRAGKPTK